jgi:hypothetical protein
MTTSPVSYWRKCTTCKKPIGFRQKYWICSVSTCNRVRTDLVFCDLRCFDAHVPVMNHRDAGAFERISPTEAAHAATQSATSSSSVPPSGSKGPTGNPAVTPGVKTQPTSQISGQIAAGQALSEDEILVVVSKVKAYIRARSTFNTSDSVMDILSDRIRKYADLAIQSAQRNGRKTVLDRDVS